MATTGAFENGWFKIDLSATAGAAGCVAVLNPEGAALVIDRAVLNVTTASTGACTLDVGVAATAISNDTLLDGMSVATAGIFDNIENQGTNGDSAVIWAADGYVTATEASGAIAGLVGELWLKYSHR